MSITLSQAANTAAKFINQTNRHIFLTGKAGTGKTTFLKHIIANTHKKAAIVAPTGIAAINAGGSTIHSMFQLPFGSFVPVSNYRNTHLSIQLNDKTSLFKNHHLSSIKKSLLREIELLIIDEVSMLRADLLDAMDAKMRQSRGRNNLSFGGVQVLFIGDMFQLPPVIKDEEWKVLSEFYKSPYFFDAHVLQSNPPIYIELDKIFRQSNQQFIDLLNNLRNNTVTSNDAKLLNSFYKPGFKQSNGDNYINLTTHNYKANAINKSFLDELKSPSYHYYADVTGDFQENLFPVDAKLELKVGAQIMFIKNDISGNQNYFNGKIAKVSSLSQKEITVQFEDGTYHTLEKYTWENKRFKVNETTNEVEEEVLGEFKHYPIKLAWAITVHKSQGLTFEKAIIDVADAFAPGQVYVALSRLKDLNGLILTTPINFESLKGDQLITSFSENSTQQQSLSEQLSKETVSYLQYYLNVCYDFSLLSNSFKKHYAELSESKKSKPKASLLEWTKGQTEKIMEMNEVALKFSGQLNAIIQKQEADWKIHLTKRVTDAQNYFTPLLKKTSQEILNKISLLLEEKKTKQFITELKKLELLVYEQIKKISKSTALCNSLINGEEFTKDDYKKIADTATRLEELKTTEKFVQSEKKEKGVKREKGATQKTSFEMYQQGLTIEEIAKERNMALTTIEGHLAKYVKEGMLNVNEFVSDLKLKVIYRVIEKLQTESAKLIKENLDDSFTYGEIRFALASFSKEESV